ncbi:MAG TPA: hypothetical protein VMW50_01160 [Dehalococcoidia bacterium]|nr:hypothetical protein [Dehalococcoidia bacterium]
MGRIVSEEIKILASCLPNYMKINSLFLPYGPTEIVTVENETEAGLVVKSLVDSFDRELNVLLNCTADIGLDCLKEKVSSVVGIGSAGFEQATLRKKPFFIIVPNSNYIPSIEIQTKGLFIDYWVGGIYSMGCEVSEFVDHREYAVRRLLELVERNRVLQTETVLFGCGTMILLYRSAPSLWRAHNIIEPTIAGLHKLMIMMDVQPLSNA